MTVHFRQERSASLHQRQPTSDFLSIDLFAGAGGLSQGFRDAGFTVVQAIDSEPNALATYCANHPTTDPLCEDIRKLDPATCLQRLGLRPGELFAVIGGPPCQGFSESNRRTRTPNNPRNHLYRYFVRFVEHTKPKWVVLENVAGLRTMANSVILDAILAELTAAGYHASWQILNAARYGVPQVRRRLFVVANRINLTIPQAFDRIEQPVTVKEAIGDLPRLTSGASEDILRYGTPAVSEYQRVLRRPDANHVSGNLVTKNAAYVLLRYKYIPQGSNWRAIPRRLMGNYADATRCHTGIYHRLRWDRPSKVIGNFRKNMLVHPKEHRGLSIREAARLQSFPDNYQFSGSIGFRQQQVADAVPPLLAQALARAILAACGQTGRDASNNHHYHHGSTEEVGGHPRKRRPGGGPAQRRSAGIVRSTAI